MPDIGHMETDKELAALEERISRIYRQSAEETQKKLDDYLRRFKVKDEIKRKDLADGKITQDQYNYWRTGQIMIGKRWQDMVDTLAEDCSHANQIANDLINGRLPDVYALNHNYIAYKLEHDTQVDMNFTMYDHRTVERMLLDDPDLLPAPKVDIPADLRWNKQHINNAVLQGILQGESIDHLAKRLQTVSDMNNRAAVRNARTAVTGAENAGRVDSYKHAHSMGINLEQEWLATLDGRTRDSHRHLDGERVVVGKKFSNGCRFPGDPEGPPREVWNCRCTLVAAIKGIDQSKAPRASKLGSMTYEEWKNGHTKDKTFQAAIPTLQAQIGTASSVYEINDIMNAQGWWGTRKVAHVDRDLNVTYTEESTMADLSGCSLESAKSIASSYQQVFEKYPQLKGKFGAPEAKFLGGNTYAQCHIMTNGKVEVNAKWYNNWKKVSDGYDNDVRIGWHPVGTTAESIVTHEIGHAVDGLLAREGILGSINKTGEYRYASSLMRAPTMKACGMYVSDIKWVVSEYASMNPQEWFAECFAEYITSANPGKVATEFGKRLEKLMEKVK